MSERLLLHTCCAPCLTQSLRVAVGQDAWEKVIPGVDVNKFVVQEVGVFFFNPNLYPAEEYQHRYDEVLKVAERFKQDGVGVRLYGRELQTKETVKDWYYYIAGLESEPEKGKRCHRCYTYRLDRAFRYAVEKGFTVVATTLTLSPLKDTAKINEIGLSLAATYGVRYLVTDFKKNNGYQKSIQWSKEWGLYRQNYCGCEYSIRKDSEGLIKGLLENV